MSESMTRVKPILFSGPMVRALLDGRKTQTRRVLKDQDTWSRVEDIVKRYPEQKSGLPYAVGDLLWVRETWANIGSFPEIKGIVYRADTDGERVRVDAPWRPSIHMPIWASRLTLEVTGVKVERLQQISEDDAIAEGVTKVRDHCYVIRGLDYDLANLCHSRPAIPFAKLWESLNAKRGYGWDANPFVVALTFKVHKMNVDAFLDQRAAA